MYFKSLNLEKPSSSEELFRFNDLFIIESSHIKNILVLISSLIVVGTVGRLFFNSVSILSIFPPGIEQNMLTNQVEQNIYDELNKIS